MTVRVEPYTLDWKARAIAEPMPAMPEPPVAADGTQIATDGLEQLTSGASKLKGYLESGGREAKRLSETFTAAAEAYRQVDVETATALANGETSPQIAPVTPRPILSDPLPVPSDFAGLNSDPVPTYASVEQIAEQLEQPDQAASLNDYTTNLKLFSHDLIVYADNFKDSGLNWTGAAADNAMAALDKHRAWLLQMVDTTRALADSAEELAKAHSIAKSNHPTTEQVKQLLQQMQMYGFSPQAMAAYQALQAKSDEVQTSYANGAKVPVCHPPKPPSGSPTVPPITGNGDPRDDQAHKMNEQPGTGTPPGGSGGSGSGGGGGGGTPDSSPQVPTDTAPVSPASAEQPKSEEPKSGGSPSGGGAPSGGSPSEGGGSGGGMPSLPGGDPSTDMPSLPDPSLMPASTDAGAGGGGSGGGAGGGGVGAMPLQPAASGPAIGTLPSAGGTAGAHAPAAAGASGGMSGGMGGGMPMGGHGQGGGGKEKRRTPGLSPDEVIYTEEREWTEAYIGQQAKQRRTAADGKDTK